MVARVSVVGRNIRRPPVRGRFFIIEKMIQYFTMATVEELEKEIQQIKDRNQRVESDKAWETSFFRRFLLALFTYLAIGLYLQAINISKPWLNAIVPAVAFMLSTLAMPFFKRVWLKYFRKNK